IDPPPPNPTAAAATPARVGQPGPPYRNWWTWETPNFRIFHKDYDLAERVARAAEEAREHLIRRWSGTGPRGTWSPKCDIYLYPTAEVFQAETQQPPDSPGFSNIVLNPGRVDGRRINVNLDARSHRPDLISALLPHELTHIVLADSFTAQQIPRWADEGMACLAEPPAEQQRRATDLAKHLDNNLLFHLDALMGVSDYPDGKHWELFYAQSVSLTRFLVERGTPAQFVRFVQAAQRNGYDAELRRVYKIDGLAALERQWLAHVRKNATAVAAASDSKERR
ncbi:MAG: hypothetical protein IRY99_25315, partial [Isosphaeraceae bacterium]|nr:hypothetical protein [Isosphaeraceae bacterium]